MKMKMIAAPAALACLALCGFAQQSSARHINVGYTRDKVSHMDVTVPQGQTFKEDIVTDKSVTIDGVLEGDCTSLGGPVIVNGRMRGNALSMGGPVRVSGLVDGDVASMGGPVEISGEVTGDIASLGGNITLLSTATVGGDIASLGGRIEKGGGVMLKGKVSDMDLRLLRRMLPGFTHGRWHSDGVPFTGAMLLGLMMFSALATGLLVVVLPAVFFPKNVETAACAISADFWKAAGVGTLVVLGIFPGLLGLLISIIGIPLVPLALLLLACAGALGVCAFSSLLCDRFFAGIKRRGPQSLAAKVCVGYLLVAAMIQFGRLLPLIGWILFLAGFAVAAFGLLVGLGAAFITRMGTGRATVCAPVSAAAPAPAAAAPFQPIPAAPPVPEQKRQQPPADGMQE